MKKILIYTSKLLPISESFIRDQTLALQNFKPALLGRRRVKNSLDIPGVEQLIAKRSQHLGKIEQYLWLPERVVKEKIKSISPDLIHIHFATAAVDLWPSIKNMNVPVFITLHGVDINTYKEVWLSGRKGTLGRLYPKRLLKISEQSNVKFIAVSEAIKNSAMEFGIPENKICVSYIGLDINKFQPSTTPIHEKRKKILFTGRFVEKKAPLLLIEAYAKVKTSVPDAELTMIGDGPLLESAKLRAKELDLDINFLGAVHSDVVARELDSSRVFCLPSIRAESGDAEGFGIVVLEAMASAVSVITSARGGAGEGVINGESGLCFEEGNLEQLQNGLVSLLTDNQLAERFSKAGLQRARDFFDNRKTIKHLEGLYLDALKNSI